MSIAKSLLPGALLLGGVSVHASVIPEAQVHREALFNLVTDRFSSNTFGTDTFADDRFGAISVSALGTPAPSVASEARIGPNTTPLIFGRGTDFLSYSFEILGPTASLPVLIDVSGAASGFATSGSSFVVQAGWGLLDGGVTLAGDDINSGQLSVAFDQSFGHTLDLTLQSNHLYSIFMNADSSAAATLEGSRADASAFVDPVLSFGSGVDPLAYSFQFSDGIGNSSPIPQPVPVPEPGPLLLMGAGLVFFVMRARRPMAVT